MNGYLNLLKPPGMSSAAAVAFVKRLTHEKCGHSGTLDPEVAGVLPVMVGRATRLQQYFSDKSKAYIGEICFAGATDTQDAQGEIIEPGRGVPTREALERVIRERFLGEILQTPPMYSAVFKNGVRLYELARQGIETQREPRQVHVGKLELTGFDPAEQSGSLLVSCSKGTYIRSICDDIGRLLGCGCVMTSLRRTRACGFDVSQAVPLDRIRELAKQGEGAFDGLILPVDSVFSELPAVHISEKQAVRFKNGAPLTISRLRSLKDPKDGEIFRVYRSDGLFLAIGQVSLEKQELAVKKQF